MSVTIEDYDLNRSDEYCKLKSSQPMFCYLFPNTLVKLLGEVREKNVLDVGCGDGFYCRLLKQKGAGKVVGIDLSQHMVKKAIEQEERNPLGCQYRVGNATEDSVEDEEKFDFVIAIFVLVYAENEKILSKFCNYMGKNLKPGGRCVAFIRNCLSTNFWDESTIKFGYQFTKLGSTEDGGFCCKTKLANEFSVTNFCLRPETYEKCFRNAGFSSFTFKTIDVANESWLKEYSDGYWDDYYKNPHQIAIVADK